jgi:glutamate-1-semialdehyde 2,1-aminomutase
MSARDIAPDRRGIDRARLSDVRQREDRAFAARTPRSRTLLERAGRAMPSGVPMSWMAGLTMHPPIYVTAGEGGHFTDVDGHRYLDMNQADLSMTCGFAPAPVIEAVRRRVAEGPSFLLPTEDAIAVSELLAERFRLPFWQFTLSATGANSEALRIARLATGRGSYAAFEGRYHGHADEMLAESTPTGESAEYLGLTPEIQTRAVSVPFNDLPALRKLLETKRFACLIAEPALTNCGLVSPDDGFWAEAAELCRATGTLLILDETHTHSFVFGGLGRAWGIDGDMITLGKSLGGGIPIGAYGMTEPLARLMERHLDRHRGGRVLPTGGTMYANAVALAAARAALSEVLTAEAYVRVDSLGQRLQEGLRASFERRRLAWRAPRIGGRCGYCLFPDLPRDAAEAAASLDYDLIDARRVYMANRGVWDAIASAGPAAAFAHTPADIETYVAVADEFLGEVAA